MGRRRGSCCTFEEASAEYEMMRLTLPFIAAIFLSSCVHPRSGATNEPSGATSGATRDRRLDPASSLESRIGEPHDYVLKMLKDDEAATPTAHTLTPAEQRTFSSALAALPPLFRRILGERLRTVSFLDGMPNTALTTKVEPETPDKLFDITIRVGVLHENLSEFFTKKERTCFDTTGSPRSVSIEAGTLDAIFYVLLHEGTHIIDGTFRAGPDGPPGEPPMHGLPVRSLIAEAWSGPRTFAPQYRDPLLERINFTPERILPIAQAEAVYTALRRTPFLSLYGTQGWGHDLTETVVWYYLSERLKQPYRIVLRDDGKEVFVYEPMKSPLVRSRFAQMDRFYEDPNRARGS